MKFVRIIEGYDHLWAVKEPDKTTDELTQLFRDWTNGEYLFDFFMGNMKELKEYFHIERINETVNDTFEDAEVLQELVLEFT